MVHPPNVSEPGNLLVGAAVGSGIAAQTAERGGADFLLAVNAGRMRNMGAPSIASMLPCHDATLLTEDFAAREVLPRVGIPVLLGVNCWGADAAADHVLSRIGEHGFAGAVNFPNATLMPRGMRSALDRAGRGFRREIDVLRRVQDAGLLALYYCGTKEHARTAGEAGLRMILLNFGWNAGGSAGHSRRASLEEVGLVARDYAALIRGINPEARILLEGGPVVSADDLGHVASVASLDGYVGGSTLDRLPFEESVLNRIAGYRQASDRRRRLTRQQTDLQRWGHRHGLTGSAPAMIAFLQRLRALSQVSERSVALALEPGAPLTSVVSALHPDSRGQMPQLDASAGDHATRLAQRLFGRDSEEGHEGGLLTDPAGGAILLRNIHLALPGLQRRLARSLRERMLVTSRRRRRMKVYARCLFVFDRSSLEAPLPDNLHSELAELLAGWTMTMPPLRDRIEDLGELIETTATASGMALEALPRLTPGALQRLRRHNWARNEAELEQFVGRMLDAGGDQPLSSDVVDGLLASDAEVEHAQASEADIEKRRIVDALWRHGFNKGETAAALNISRKTLYNRMKRLGLRE